MAGGRVALGLSVHTGWAACVVVAGSLRRPRIDAREEIELLGDPDRFAYHRAAELTEDEAARSIEDATARARGRARAAVARIVGRAREEANGANEVAGIALVANAAPMPAPLRAVLEAHPRIHAAEGCMYRDALIEAARDAGLDAQVFPSKTLGMRAAKAMHLDADAIGAALAAAGKVAGRPWAKDQRDAALAAWILLTEA
jgi:hypothetical protein